MSQPNIKVQIRQFVAKNFPLARQQANLLDTDSLFNSGIVDSLGVLDLVTFIEDEFGVIVADEDLLAENFETIEQMEAFVQAKQGQKIPA
ncbi:MAG: acyl carrier protein [Chloroflexi bacterium]|nr:acyl carrier protein [Chloroflexota bacterium]